MMAAIEKLSAGEMQKIYDAAYAKGHADGAEQGRRSAVIAAAMPMGIIDTSNVGPGVNGYDWLQIAQHLAAHEHMFSGQDARFCKGHAEEDCGLRLTPRQGRQTGCAICSCKSLAEGLIKCSRLLKCASRW